MVDVAQRQQLAVTPQRRFAPREVFTRKRFGRGQKIVPREQRPSAGAQVLLLVRVVPGPALGTFEVGEHPGTFSEGRAMLLTPPRGESRYFVLALFTISMVAGAMLYGGTGAIVPYVGGSFGLGHAQLGLIATALTLGGLFTVPLSGTLCDRFGDKAMLLESGLLMGGAMIAAALFPNYFWLLACLFLYGAGYAASNPAGTHAILAFFAPTQRGLAMGIRQTGMPVGGALGGLLFAGVGSHYGYGGALIAGGAIVLVVCTASALLYRQPKELCGEHVAIEKLLKDIGHIGKDRRLILVTLASMLLDFTQT